MLTTNLPDVVKFVTEMADAAIPDPNRSVGIGWERDGEVVAGVVYENYKGASIEAGIAVASGAVITKEFLWAIFDYPFNQLKVGLVIVYIAESNWKSRNLAERMGFELETRIVGAYPDGDMLIYTMTAGNCRWLESKHEIG